MSSWEGAPSFEKGVEITDLEELLDTINNAMNEEEVAEVLVGLGVDEAADKIIELKQTEDDELEAAMEAGDVPAELQKAIMKKLKALEEARGIEDEYEAPEVEKFDDVEEF